MILRLVERGLIAIGAALALWCIFVLVEARYTQSLPPEKLVVTQTLPPGVPSNPGVAASPPPARGTVLARLEVPSVNLATTVLEGSDDGTLRKASGHIEETPLPGQPGNIGIAGHRDTVFRALRNIHDGDPLRLTTADRVYRYRITKTFIVEPNDVYVLDPTDRPTLTLVTCYPFEFVGHAPHRFIVQAELVGEHERTQSGGSP
jgi:sortase A